MSPIVVSIISALILLIFVFGIGFVGGNIYGSSKRDAWWWNEMIRRRHARYHWEDGKVYWNEDEPKTPWDPAAAKVDSRDAVRNRP